MRQIGSLSKKVDAERLAAYLVVKGISAQADPTGDDWAIWVRDENRLAEARDAFVDFKHNPEDARYKNVEQTAAELRREEAAKRDAAKKHIVEMRGKWGRSGGAKRAPLVFVLIGLCVMASLWTNSMSSPEAYYASKEADMLRFASVETMQTADSTDELWMFSDIRQGEVWRLITPIFMHGGMFHLVMNIYWLYYFGSQIEHFEGTPKFAVLVLLGALISNIAQAISVGPNFLGISGVGAACFGYVWIKSRYELGSKLYLSNFTLVIFIGYLFYALTLDDVANEAHFVGLGVGAAMAYLLILAGSSKSN